MLRGDRQGRDLRHEVEVSRLLFDIALSTTDHVLGDNGGPSISDSNAGGLWVTEE